jgi:hypothetical protein
MGMKLYEAFIENNSRSERVIYIIYIILQFITLTLAIVDLALNRWFQYCYWHFGLVYAESFTEYSELDNEETISDVKDDVCDDSYLQEEVERSCSNFCDYIDKFRQAGVVMIVFGLGSLVLLVINVLMHLLKLHTQRKRLPEALVVVCCFGQPALYAVGLLLYSTIGELNDLEDAEGPSTGANEYPRDYKAESGIKLAYAVGILSACVAIYAFFLTKNKLTT